jgi:hypothetical protein
MQGPNMRERSLFRDGSTRSSPGPSPFYIFVIIIILIALRVVRRTYANYRGTRFSLPRTVIFAAVYVAIGILFSAISFVAGVSPLLAIPQVAVATIAVFLSYRYADRRITFWKGSGGALYFRGGILIYLIYLAGLLARLFIDIILIGPSMFSFATASPLSGTALYGSMATDLLLIFGVGLLIGRNIRVVTRYRRIERGEETVPDSDPNLARPVG